MKFAVFGDVWQFFLIRLDRWREVPAPRVDGKVWFGDQSNPVMEAKRLELALSLFQTMSFSLKTFLTFVFMQSDLLMTFVLLNICELSLFKISAPSPPKKEEYFRPKDLGCKRILGMFTIQWNDSPYLETIPPKVMVSRIPTGCYDGIYKINAHQTTQWWRRSATYGTVWFLPGAAGAVRRRVFLECSGDTEHGQAM